jgi:hypothetical protein
MKWSDAYEKSGWTIVVPVKLIQAIGAKGAILISQFFYWKGRQKDAHGWIYKTKTELQEETGLSRHEQDTCTAELKKLGVLETRHDRLEHRLYYRICTEVLDGIMESHSPSESRKAAFGKAGFRLSPNPESGFRESHKAAFVLKTENTTEFTSESTTETTTTAREKAASKVSRAHVVVAIDTKEREEAFQKEASIDLTSDEGQPSSIGSASEADQRAAGELASALWDEFGLNEPQADDVCRIALKEGLGYVRAKAALTRDEPRKNAAAFFMKAVREDWQPKVKIGRKNNGCCF